jgi:hypothetical protein
VAKDYEKYKDRPNVTFVGICASPSADVKQMKAQCGELKIADLPFPKMLDAGGATSSGYNLQSAAYTLVVVDHAGKIAYNGPSAMFYGKPNEGEVNYCRHVEADKILKNAPGLLPGMTVPDSMRTALHYYNLQQYDRLDLEVATVLKTDKSAEAKQFGEAVQKKIVEFRANRLKELTALAESDPVAASPEVKAFMESFPKAPEAAAAKALLTKLAANPKVRKEAEAETAYQNVIVPLLKKTTNMQAFSRNVKPVMDAYLQRYGDTRFAKTVESAVAAHRKSISSLSL